MLGVVDLNDDDTMLLCKLKNELNACESGATLNPSRFLSHATRWDFVKASQWTCSLHKPMEQFGTSVSNTTKLNSIECKIKTVRASCGKSAK